MNILFLLRGTGIGGLEVVTSVLANKFVKEGHHVDVFIFRKEEGNSIVERFDKDVKVCQQNDYRITKDNVRVLRQILIKDKINFIINQWGLPLVPIMVARRASKGLGVKIISVYHNAPSSNGRIQAIDIKLSKTENPLKRISLRIIRYMFKCVTSRSMAYIYHQSDRFVVLSKGFIPEFQKFTQLRDLSKLCVITNPITIDSNHYIYNPEEKVKEIIYVGRLDFVQKRVYRVIDTWNLLENHYQDWKLTIVGDGPDRSNLENHVKALNLKHVYFEGFQNPVPYYRRASILMLTSDFEGFPLVLAEAMSLGVVPVVYDSFVAVRDILDNGKNGVIVPKVHNDFSAELMAKGLEKAIEDCEKNHDMALAAIEESKRYSLDEIYSRWLKFFDDIRNDKLIPN
jgi:glycosyltransferase involved in cell wall biosynthesis